MYTTKSGQPITFTITKRWLPTLEPHQRHGESRGWITDKITAFVDGEEVGYMKIGYIPKNEFSLWYPSLYNWVSTIRGSGFLNNITKLQGPKQWDDATCADVLAQARRSSAIDARTLLAIDKLKDKNLSPRDILLKAEAKAKRYKWDTWNKFQKFRDYHMDKPHPDYIRVHSPKDGTRSHSMPSQCWRRQGIGLALYQKASDYAGEQGMKFWSSDLQSPEAKGIWSFMENQGWVFEENGRRFLDFGDKTHQNQAA